VRASLPHGIVTVKAVKGGLDIPIPENNDPAVIASAAVCVRLESAVMLLYEHPLSSYAQKVKIALREKGVDFKAETPRRWARARPTGRSPRPARATRCRR
jgi:hypothetical protein